MRYAAIDIGSNAIRLLIKDIDESNADDLQPERIAYYRVPLRLGGDVFERGKLSKAKTKSLVKVMVAFRNLIDVQEVLQVLVVLQVHRVQMVLQDQVVLQVVQVQMVLQDQVVQVV